LRLERLGRTVETREGLVLARLTATLVAAVLLVALPAGAEAAKPWKVRQIARSGAVAAGNGQIGTLTVRCRRGYVATSGAFVSYSPGVATLRSVPSGRRSWIFGAGNTTATQGSFQVVVNCVLLRPPRRFKTKLGASTHKREINLAGGATGTLTVRCRRGHAPAGFGGEFPGVAGAPARAADVGMIGPIDVRAAVPSRGRWRFTLRNLGSAPARARMITRCIARRAIARRKRTRRARTNAVTSVSKKKTKRTKKKRKIDAVVTKSVEVEDVQAGNNDGLRVECVRDHVPVGAGHELPTAASTFLYTAYPDSTGLVFNIFSVQPQRVELSGLCLDTGTSWEIF
jgi:hypothetical protein